MTRPALRRPADIEQRTTALELFYDLVFVFAVTQVSHHLLDDLTWRGAGESALLLLVVWWSWNYTTWVTNELDPESITVRMVLIGLMLASFLMAVAIPEAFGDRGLLGHGRPRARAAAPGPGDHGRGDRGGGSQGRAPPRPRGAVAAGSAALA